MRCIHCEGDPGKPERYCPCCGRAVTAAQATAIQATAELPPAPPPARKDKTAAPAERGSSMGLAFAAVFAALGTFGVGTWLINMQQPPAVAAEIEPTTADPSDEPPRTDSNAPTDISLSKPAADGKPSGSEAASGNTGNGSRSAASLQSSPAAPRPRTQPKPVRSVLPPSETTAPSSVKSSAPEPTASAATEVAASAPAASAVPAFDTREPPRGPFFAPTDVTEGPRIVTRVEPKLPDGLRHQPVDEIVIVRLLVSQTGHPFRVSLLRRSKAGLPLDDAVIAAVNQWTFSPARKKGEAVSSWYNLGVPIRSSGSND